MLEQVAEQNIFVVDSLFPGLPDRWPPTSHVPLRWGDTLPGGYTIPSSLEDEVWVQVEVVGAMMAALTISNKIEDSGRHFLASRELFGLDG